MNLSQSERFRYILEAPLVGKLQSKLCFPIPIKQEKTVKVESGVIIHLDNDCPPDYRCGGGLCTHECNSFTPCTGNRVCSNDRCYYPCTSDNDCASNQLCIFGFCNLGCLVMFLKYCAY